MSRHLPRLFVGLAVCLALASCSKQAGSGRALCADCNVVLISMDTVRADHLGAYGYDVGTSPNVDRLAERAVVFERAVSQSAWTLPAHGSMMTGLYPGRLGVTHYPAKRRLPTGVPMLAEEFKKAGYATAGFTGGGFVARHFGFGRGFDIYSTDGRRFEHNMDEAVSFLKSHTKRRFFMFLHGYNAHRPYFSLAADKKAVGLSTDGPIEQRGFCMRGRRERPDDLDRIIKYYDASIHHGDRQVGRFLDALTELGLDDNTVVLITSDHGEEFFEHGNCDHVRFLYREVVDVPYILYVPGLTPEGHRVPGLVPASISVARTLLDVAGVDHNMPGPSLAGILRGEDRGFGAVYSETASVTGKLGSRGETVAMTTPRQKLVRYTQEGAEEAYDLARDPFELRVLPAGHEAYGRRKTLEAWHVAMSPLPKPTTRVARAATPDKARTPAQNRARAAAQRAARARANAAAARAGRTGKTAPPARPARPADPADDAPEELPEDLKEHLRSLGYLED